jgi:hypothetical protein
MILYENQNHTYISCKQNQHDAPQYDLLHKKFFMNLFNAGFRSLCYLCHTSDLRRKWRCMQLLFDNKV